MKKGYFNNVSVDQLINVLIICEHSRDFNLLFKIFNFIGIVLVGNLKCGLTHSLLGNRIKFLSNIRVKRNHILIVNNLTIPSFRYHL